MFDQRTIDAAKANFAALDEADGPQAELNDLAAKIAANEASQERARERLEEIGRQLTDIREGRVDPGRAAAARMLDGEDASTATVGNSTEAELKEETKALREAYGTLRRDLRLLFEEQKVVRPTLASAKYDAARPLIEAAEVEVRRVVADLARAYAAFAAIDRVAMHTSEKERELARALNILRDYADTNEPIPVPIGVQEALGALLAGEDRGGPPKSVNFPMGADLSNPTILGGIFHRAA